MSKEENADRLRLPGAYKRLNERYPDFARAYHLVGDAAHRAGPLNERERRLVKLALSVASRQEGGVHAQARKALLAGISPEELRQVVLLAMTNIGFPAMAATMTWVDEVIEDAGNAAGSDAAPPAGPGVELELED
jgi:4-carboxymuconolactone decarboxylase